MTQIWLTSLVIISKDACRRGCVISTPTPKAKPLLRHGHNAGQKELYEQYDNIWCGFYNKELNVQNYSVLTLSACHFCNSVEWIITNQFSFTYS